ncbi:MAG: hypothetical protein IPJ75_03955 [Ignavibacteriales bacterium]|nr:hypothetical protein [Ignavibacteriales bacterium]
MFIKIFSSIIIFTSLLISTSLGQPWSYDFGTSTGVHNTNAANLDFLPAAPSGLDRVRVGSGGGSFNLENQTIAFGSGSYLRGVAPTSTSVNKFSVYDYTAGKAAIISFRVRFGNSSGENTGASSGAWSFFLGDGATYSDNSTFAGAQSFTGIRWSFGASGAITGTLNYTKSGAKSIATNKFDIWVNGILVGDEVAKAQ